MRFDAAGKLLGDAADIAKYERGDIVVGNGKIGVSSSWNGAELFLVTSEAPPDAGVLTSSPHKLRVLDASGAELSPPVDFATDIWFTDPAIASNGRDYWIAWSDGPTYTLGHAWLARANRCN